MTATTPAPSGSGFRVGSWFLTGLLLLSINSYGCGFFRWAFGPETQNLPQGLTVGIVNGQYQMRAERRTELTFDVVARNVECANCDFGKLIVSLSQETRQAEPIQDVERIISPNELTVGQVITVSVNQSTLFIGLPTLVSVRLVPREAANGEQPDALKTVTIPALRNASETLTRHALGVPAPSVFRFPDQ